MKCADVYNDARDGRPTFIVGVMRDGSICVGVRDVDQDDAFATFSAPVETMRDVAKSIVKFCDMAVGDEIGQTEANA